MQSFELQVYKSGKWEFDSYFDDRETALFEAERLHDSDRYHGIRVLEEQFREDSATSQCSVIFSRVKKVGASDDQRTRASREAYRMAVRDLTKPDRENNAGARGARKQGSRNKSKARSASSSGRSAGAQRQTSLRMVTVMAVIILILGVGAMVALRYMEGAL